MEPLSHVDVIENGHRRGSRASRFTVAAAVVAALLTVAAVRLHGSHEQSSAAAQASPAPSSGSAAEQTQVPDGEETLVPDGDDGVVLLHFDDEFTTFDHGTFLVEFKLFNDNGRRVSMTASQMPAIPGIRDSVVRILPLTDWEKPEPGVLEPSPGPLPVGRGQAAVYAVTGHVTCGHTPTVSRDYPTELIVDGTSVTVPLPTLLGRSWESAVKRRACN